MNKELKRNKKNNEEEKFTPFFSYLDDVDEDFLIQEVYRLETVKKPLVVQFKDVSDVTYGVPYLIEDMKRYIELDYDNGVVIYPVYNELEAFPIYKTTSFLPPTGLKILRSEALYQALGVITVTMKEIAMTQNEGDTRYIREQRMNSLDDYFIYDYSEGKWLQTDNKNPELQDRLNRKKRLELVFAKKFADYYEKITSYRDNPLSNKRYPEVLEEMKVMKSLINSSKSALYGFIYYNNINQFQFKFLNEEIRKLESNMELFESKFAEKIQHFANPNEVSYNTLIPDLEWQLNDQINEFLIDTQAKIHAQYMRLFRFDTNLITYLTDFDKDKDKFIQVKLNEASFKGLGYHIYNATPDRIEFFERFNLDIFEFVPSFSYLNFILGKTTVAVKLEKFNEFNRLLTEYLSGPIKV